MNKWYAYKTEDGELHAKRFLDYRDMEEIDESPFVTATMGPFEAYTREEALTIADSVDY